MLGLRKRVFEGELGRPHRTTLPDDTRELMKELRAVWIEIEDPVGDGNIDRSTGEGDSLALGGLSDR